MATDTSITVVAAICPQANGTPACIVRWMMGSDGDELPLVDDVFDVVVTKCALDGTKIAQVAAAVVKPHALLMLDPAREGQKLTTTSGVDAGWGIATVPTGPVVPADGNSGNLAGHPFGVCHLLAETETSRVMWRAASVAAQAMIRRRPAVAALAAVSNADIETFARVFARNLVLSGVRPRHLAPVIRAESTQLLLGLSVGSEQSGVRLLSFTGMAPEQSLAGAALISQAMLHQPTLEALDQAVTPARQVRGQLRMRSLHGGELIDYWYDPDGTGVGTPADRGHRYPAAEVVGCGCTIPVTTDLLRQLVTDRNQLLIEVSQRARALNGRADRSLDSVAAGGPPGNVLDADPPPTFEPGSRPITWFELNKASQSGRSVDIPPPTAAIVNYAMVDSSAGTTSKAANNTIRTFGTGDGKIEIIITPPDQPADQTTVCAYNVYGMWEGANGVDPFFADAPRDATLDDLRSWRMTKRYSLMRDLEPGFPPAGGAPDGRVVQLLLDGPWNPVLRQPNTMTDQSTGTPVNMPIPGALGEARYAIDLRCGMQLSKQGKAGYPEGWDLPLPADTTWTPERDRNGRALPTTQQRPQRYRFWVTSVDAFEQESTPIPVEAQDAEAGEAKTYFFEPRRRTPIPGPPAGDSTVVLAFDPGTGTLSLGFDTPPETQVAGTTPDGTSNSVVIDKTRLVAHVAIFRRRLLVNPNTRQTGTRTALRNLTLLHPWLRNAAQELNGDWRPFGAVVSVQPPSTGDRWQWSTTLAPNQSGWEYRAAISFAVAPAFLSFWAPDVTSTNASNGRSLYTVSQDTNGNPIYVASFITETPRTALAFFTNSVPVPNSAQPRGAQLSLQSNNPDLQTKMLFAATVPCPPGLRRDLILMKILSQGFASNGTAVQPTPNWRGTGIALTAGQSTMCDCAILRTALNPADPNHRPVFDPADPRFSTTQAILAAGFAPTTNPLTPLRQHATIGFRGLLNLCWTYQPLEVVPPGTGVSEAEATSFKIYYVRAPKDLSLATTYATVGGTGHLVAGEYQLTITKGADDSWSTIATHHLPTLVSIRANADADPIWGTVAVAKTMPDGSFRVEIANPTGALPGDAILHLFAAQPIATIQPPDLDSPQSIPLLLPVGGGLAERMAWWIVSVSAMGLETTGTNSPVWQAAFGPTVEPEIPIAVAVRGPRSADSDFLDPATFRAYLPAGIESLEDAKYYPHLVLTWAPGDAGTFVEIDRQAQQVAQQQGTLLTALDDNAAWKAILDIAAAKESDQLDLADLSSIEGNWLMGQVVESEPPPVDADLFVSTDKPLDAQRGLIELPSEEVLAGVATRPALVDYYGGNPNPNAPNHDANSVMDGNWQYRYRLTAYVDLGSQFPDAWRYLRSAPSAWTTWALPETPPLQVETKALVLTEIAGVAAPTVSFSLIPDPPQKLFALSQRMRVMDSADHRWEYRVVVRRELDTPMPSSQGPVAPEYVDIGVPMPVSSTTGSRMVVDDRVDRSWIGDQPVINYRVLAQQYLITNGPDGTREKLIRGFDVKTPNVGYCDIPITLTAPQSPQNEVKITQTIALR